MDRLSSCYFCGIALDEPLRDYPLAPGDDDPNAVVTLCPTCRRKLETVLSAVTSPPAEESEDPIVMGNETVDRDENATHEAADIETAADVTAAAESAAVDSEDTGVGDDPEPDGQPDEAGPDSTGATGGEAVEDEIQSMMEPDVPEDLQTGGRDDSDSESPGGAGDDEPAESRDTDDGSTGDDGAQTTVSALEYNKVMRLLQNREFPVERAEIVALAANAYELTEAECGEVVDLAVDRGLVDQEDGQLVRPDG